MKKSLLLSPLLFAVIGCAAQTQTLNSPLPEAVTGAGSLSIDQHSVAKDVLRAIPTEAATERFVMQDRDGHRIAYAGLVDGEIGGIVFVDNSLVGTLSQDQAHAFYACRGYATANHQYWGQEASAWTSSLLRVATPAQTTKLVFSGKSTVQSIKSIVDNPLVGQIKALADMGTNPLSVVKTLNKARENYQDHVHNQDVLKALGSLAPGDTESTLAAAVPPEDLSFVTKGLVMAYPKYSIEFFVEDGTIRAIQQPSFNELAHNRAALFYLPGVDWTQCTPQSWMHAVSRTTVAQ